MRILFSYLKSYKKIILLTLLLATISQIFILLDPLIIRYILDKYIKNYKDYSTSEFFKGAGLLILLAVGVAMISRLAKNFQDYFVNVITQRVGANIYSDGLAHSLELPYAAFENQRSGETLGILQKVKSDSERLIIAFTNVFFTTVISVVFVFIYVIHIHWFIAVVFVFIIPILAVINFILNKKIKVVQKKIVMQTAVLSGSTTESLRNIELIKSLGLSAQEIERLRKATQKILKLELWKIKHVRSLNFVQGTLLNLVRNGILLLMLYLIYSSKISAGEFFSLFLYSTFIFNPLQEMASVINIYGEAAVSLENFSAILNVKKEVRPLHPVTVNRVMDLEFKGVSFKHQSSGQNALDDISFRTTNGQTIAFVGPSGSGKTTLIKLLVGLYQPKEGTVQYNGVTSTAIDMDLLRSKIGFVTQEPQLFSGTIRENMLFVCPGATDEDCLAVLHKAACQKLLSRADKGLDTVIGEGGVKISGGEKQRLSIARALLRKPEILVFDEATSSLDSITEEEVTEAIRGILSLNDYITIFIAHRLSTVMHADRIYVLEKGQIIEAGKHDELLAEKGLYYAMWRQQIGAKIN